MKFLKRLLLLSSILIVFYSCNKYISVDYIPKKIPDSFLFNKKNLLFKSSIYLGKKYFSGLMYIKPITDDSVRFIMLSEMGPKVIDFTLTQEKEYLNFCIEPLQKKLILQNLYISLRLSFLMFNKEELIARKEKNGISYKTKSNIEFILDNSSYKFIELEYRKSLINEIEINFNKYNIENIPEEIKISSNFNKIKIDLNLIEYK